MLFAFLPVLQVLSPPARALHTLHLLLCFLCVFVCFATDQVDRCSRRGADGPVFSSLLFGGGSYEMKPRRAQVRLLPQLFAL